MSAGPGSSLRADLEAAVREVGGPRNRALDARGTWHTVLPVGNGLLVPTNLHLAGSGRYFTLEAPLAALDRGGDTELLTSLLGRHTDADRSDGAAYAIVSSDAGDVVAVVYHWVLPVISTEQFKELLKVFARAVRSLHGDLADLQAAGAPVALLDEVWRTGQG